MFPEFAHAAADLAATGRRIYERGWAPATSGNFSARLAGGTIAITASGSDKRTLSVDDIMQVNNDGRALQDRTPSAETGLHLQLYRRDPDLGAVLHTHSIHATLVSSHAGEHVVLSGLELLKAMSGMQTHECELLLPVFDNDQDIGALASRVEAHMHEFGQGHAYLIRGHGLYSWGRELAAAVRHLEALEFLLEYHWRSNGRSQP